MAGEGTKRIIDLTEAAETQSGDYIAIDSTARGTKKTPVSVFAKAADLTAEQTARQQADAAEAQAREEAVADLKSDLDVLGDSVKEAYSGYSQVIIDIKHDGYYSRYNAFASDEGRSYAVLSVNEGEHFKITSFIQSGVIPAIIYRDSNNALLGYDKLGTGTGEVITDYEFVIPTDCTTLIVQSASYDYELSLKKYTTNPINKDMVIKNTISLKLGTELLTSDASLMSTGWSGSNLLGYTHASGYSGDLKFSLGGLVDIGCDYLFEFDTDYTADEFLSAGLGNSYRILAYNGTGHIVLPLRAIDSFNLFITPYKNVSFTISNLSLKKIQSEGTEKDIDFGTVLVDSNDSNYGFWNVILGEHALENAVGSTRCIAIGNGALGDLQGGHRNIGIGTFAGSQMESGEMNLIFGADGMFTVKKALSCIAIGKGAMHNGTYLKYNIAIGNGALNGSSDSVSEFNIALGANAGYACKGDRNIFMGYNTAMEVASGIANVYIGDQCTGVNGKNQNTVIGASAKATGLANRSIALGYQAQTNKENQMVLGGSNITEVILCGNKKIIFNNDGTVTWESIS